MLVGHFAAALGAKRIEPRMSLGSAALAAVIADLLFFIFMVAGCEGFRILPGVARNPAIGNIPYSHSLLMLVFWAALLAGGYFLLQRFARGALILAALVLSHWVLDTISHRPDMQLAPGLPVAFGLGLWNSIPATVVVEGGFWLLTVVLYARFARATNIAGAALFWIGVAFLTLAWVGNIRHGIDPNPIHAGIGGFIFFSVMVAWAYSADRLRRRS